MKSNPYWLVTFSLGKRLLLLPTCRGTSSLLGEVILYLKVSFLLYQGLNNLSLLRSALRENYTPALSVVCYTLPADITEDEFKRLFAKYGEPGEVFINKGKGFDLLSLWVWFLCFSGGILFLLLHSVLNQQLYKVFITNRKDVAAVRNCILKGGLGKCQGRLLGDTSWTELAEE